jgi:hypothetical protein
MARTRSSVIGELWDYAVDRYQIDRLAKVLMWGNLVNGFKTTIGDGRFLLRGEFDINQNFQKDGKLFRREALKRKRIFMIPVGNNILPLYAMEEVFRIKKDRDGNEVLVNGEKVTIRTMRVKKDDDGKPIMIKVGLEHGSVPIWDEVYNPKLWEWWLASPNNQGMGFICLPPRWMINHPAAYRWMKRRAKFGNSAFGNSIADLDLLTDLGHLSIDVNEQGRRDAKDAADKALEERHPMFPRSIEADPSRQPESPDGDRKPDQGEDTDGSFQAIS